MKKFTKTLLLTAMLAACTIVQAQPIGETMGNVTLELGNPGASCTIGDTILNIYGEGTLQLYFNEGEVTRSVELIGSYWARKYKKGIKRNWKKHLNDWYVKDGVLCRIYTYEKEQFLECRKLREGPQDIRIKHNISEQ